MSGISLFAVMAVGILVMGLFVWLLESGTSEPSTSNLLALARLFGISAEELLREVE